MASESPSFSPLMLTDLHVSLPFTFVSIRFSLHDASNWVEREIYDPLTSLLSSTICKNPIVADNESFVWELSTSTYRVYGLPESRPHVSTETRTRPFSSASTFNTPPASRVKIEPSIHTVIHLSDSSDGEDPPHSTSKVEPPSSSLRPPSVTPLLLA